MFWKIFKKGLTWSLLLTLIGIWSVRFYGIEGVLYSIAILSITIAALISTVIIWEINKISKKNNNLSEENRQLLTDNENVYNKNYKLQSLIELPENERFNGKDIPRKYGIDGSKQQFYDYWVDKTTMIKRMKRLVKENEEFRSWFRQVKVLSGDKSPGDFKYNVIFKGFKFPSLLAPAYECCDKRLRSDFCPDCGSSKDDAKKIEIVPLKLTPLLQNKTDKEAIETVNSFYDKEPYMNNEGIFVNNPCIHLASIYSSLIKN